MSDPILSDQWCPVCHKPWPQPSAAKACQDCWSKRVLDIRKREGLPVGKDSAEIRFFVELHIGFLSIEETEEQLARLGRRDASIEPSPATSGIERTNLKEVTPINSTAGKVMR